MIGQEAPPTTHKITFGTLRREEERKDKMEVLYKGEDTLPPSFISLIAHGYDAARQDDFIAVLGIKGAIIHAKNFLRKHVVSGVQNYSSTEIAGHHTTLNSMILLLILSRNINRVI